MKKTILKVTTDQKIKLIEKAIDAIIDVAEDIPESNAFHFLNSENSVVNKLRDLERHIKLNVIG